MSTCRSARAPPGPQQCFGKGLSRAGCVRRVRLLACKVFTASHTAGQRLFARLKYPGLYQRLQGIRPPVRHVFRGLGQPLAMA